MHSRLTEIAGRDPLWKRLLGRAKWREATSLQDVRSLVHEVAGDRRIRGLLLEMPLLSAGWAACAGLRQAVSRLRISDKQVAVFLPQGGGNREVYVASAANRVLLAPQTTLWLLGAAIRGLYFKPLLDRVGIFAQVQACGAYKTAAEGAVLESMSDPQREQLGALLDALRRELARALCERPGFDEDRVFEVLETGLMRASAAVERGLADALCYRDQLPAVLGPQDGKPARLVSADRYQSWTRAEFWRPVRTPPYIAVLSVRGVIGLDGGGPGARYPAAPPVLAGLRAAMEDRRALGVVLHVDSPGGSAMGSDVIHREVCRLAEAKPVVACLGEVAASGGYYVSVAAHRIVAQSATVTGSIGVISAKVVAEDLLRRIGLRVQTLSMAPHADMFAPTRALDDKERAMLEREIEGYYQAFLEVVARGRHKSVQQVAEVAQGRLWSGADAVALGLADRIGGLDQAVEEVKSLLPDVPPQLKARLRPKSLRVPSGELPPPEPASSLAGMLSRIIPEIGTVMAMAWTGERVLYYDPGAFWLD